MAKVLALTVRIDRVTRVRRVKELGWIGSAWSDWYGIEEILKKKSFAREDAPFYRKRKKIRGKLPACVVGRWVSAVKPDGHCFRNETGRVLRTERQRIGQSRHGGHSSQGSVAVSSGSDEKKPRIEGRMALGVWVRSSRQGVRRMQACNHYE